MLKSSASALPVTDPTCKLSLLDPTDTIHPKDIIEYLKKYLQAVKSS